jgi:predicted Ser/Thr protein kinase
MPAVSTCPDEPELLQIAMGEPVDSALLEHVEGCANCRAQVEQLRAEVESLVGSLPPQARSTSTEPDPTNEPAANPADEAATTSWESGGAGHAATSEPPGPEGAAAARGRAERDAAQPDAIGKYKVVGRLDGGGEADVYRVIHIKLGNDLVLKLSRRPVGTDEWTGLVKEGRLLVDLEHPNLVRIYDLDLHDNRPYLVMEYVHGRNLGDYARDEALTPRRAAALVAKLAAVVGVAHRHGITHCDIKPKNVVIDSRDEPRLIDFGMARLRHAWSEHAPSDWGGTFAYMAPEQARLEVDRIGPRTDIFALGGVLYFLLTGQAPFSGENQAEIWDRARKCEFEAGALRAAKVPQRLEQIVLKAMAAEPANRFASADEMAGALDAFVRRPKVLGALAAVSGIALVGGLAGVRAWLQPSPVPSQKPTAVISHASPASLRGDLTVRVWSKEGGAKQGLKVYDPGALPLLPGEKVHVEAQLNQPAHICLLWLDSQGKVNLLYPRHDGKFGSRPSGGSARETVHSPEALDEGHMMSGSGGLETVLLLARRTPLPSGVDLPGLVGPLPPAPLRDAREVAVRGFDEGQATETLGVALHRGIADEAHKIDDALLRLMERLRTQGPFDVIKAVRFAYRGE